jgi:hypothetical protein
MLICIQIVLTEENIGAKILKTLYNKDYYGKLL